MIRLPRDLIDRLDEAQRKVQEVEGQYNPEYDLQPGQMPPWAFMLAEAIDAVISVLLLASVEVK
jgi:hypothetical protein